MEQDPMEPGDREKGEAPAAKKTRHLPGGKDKGRAAARAAETVKGAETHPPALNPFKWKHP